MANIVQGTRGEIGFEGSPSQSIGFVNASFSYDSNMNAKQFFVADRDFVVKAVTIRPMVAGTDSAAVMTIRKAANAGAMDSSATALHSSTINVKGTASTCQYQTVTASSSTLPKGSALGIVASGTLTSATGVVTVLLAPA